MAQQTSFQTIIDSLLETKKDFPRAHMRHFSDIDPNSLQAFMETWPRVKPARKLALLDGLLSLLDSDTLVSFDDLARALLNDADADVRSRAVRLLAESDDPRLVNMLVEIIRNDPDLAPRLEAANLLGEFVLLGELDELPADLHEKAEDALLAVFNSEEHASLRRLALEALGFSSRTEVDTLIHSAFNRSEPAWIASALTAMGRSNDDQYGDEVVSMLLNDDPRVRLAAVQAAGELSLETARPLMLTMLLEGEEDDDDVITAAIWSLSQIGGEDVRAFLTNMLDRTDDDEITGYIEDALENLDFTEGLDKFELLSLDEDASDEEDEE